jgi:hypothetical protein
MSSEVQIARLALQHLGDRYDITSLDEATPEAEQVKLVFDNVRDMVLREHPWTFARKYATPAQLTGVVPGNWSYMFTYPSDALRIIRIVNPLGDNQPPIRFETARNSADVHVILCNESEPMIEYTKQVTDPQQFDPQFIPALAYRIAQYIAMPITGDRSIMSDMKTLADIEIGKAQATDANEGFEAVRPAEATWIAARY